MLISSVGSLMVFGMLAAVAIPVFLNQRLKSQWNATTVTLPPSFNGYPLSTSAASKAAARKFATGGFSASSVGIYGPLGSKVVVILAGKNPSAMQPSQQDALRADFERGFADRGGPLAMIQVPDTGKLGGRMDCGSTRAVHVCLATDVGATISVVSGKDAGDPAELIRQARAAVISRK